MTQELAPVKPRRGNTELYYQVSLLAAGVAALFCLVMLGFLINNMIQARVFDPIQSSRMIALKAELAKQPQNEQIREQVRQLDWYLRQRFFTVRYQAIVGLYVLLGGVAFLILSLHTALQFRPTLRFPLLLPPKEAWLEAALHRRALVIGGLIIVSALVTLGVVGRHDSAAAYVQSTQPPGAADVLAQTFPSIEPPNLATPGTTTPETTLPPPPPMETSLPPPPPPPSSSVSSSYSAFPPPPPPPPPPPSGGGMVPDKPSAGGGKKPANGAGIAKLEPATGFDVKGGPSVEDLARNWNGFRGPFSGLAAGQDYPTSWNGNSRRNVLWKSSVPLKAPNSPVVWGDRVFMSGADAVRREVYAFDAESGKLLWNKPLTVKGAAKQEPPEVLEETGYAAPTVACDGQRVFALFANGDVGAFDFQGKQVWSRNLGVPQNHYGHASSPIVYKNLLLIQYDQGGSADEKLSSLIALNVETGKTIYRIPRPVPATWSSPLVINRPERDEVILCGNPFVISYDPSNGKELWRTECLDGEIAPSPAFAGGLVLVAQETAGLFAIRPPEPGKGNKGEIVWSYADNVPDTVSPASDGQFVWIVSSAGLVTCLDLKTGERKWEHDMKMPCNSSPVIVGKSVYLTDTTGVTHVFEAGPEYKALGSGDVGEAVHATPALVEGRIYLRGTKYLYAVGAH